MMSALLGAGGDHVKMSTWATNNLKSRRSLTSAADKVPT